MLLYARPANLFRLRKRFNLPLIDRQGWLREKKKKEQFKEQMKKHAKSYFLAKVEWLIFLLVAYWHRKVC